ncbi:ubiquitin ligase, putative [Entamoeba nuttalli P19]|uniref:HECT-type E3 ubiquitin transferase n=1 Tax=Entamoeba nuttalli (strain P19) TaxID=1076696 RepID=K2HYB3_ENTNP|nr:ubiquitin ligase, putative [Entamoeba nuttalli P19]EKE41370.1 ubiquitin ligase, putative [Entamoeba nuttalli P19]|eukprot:XP_008856291.1 ubiquitin ligase, putative [Entamoeba nuttalli P19]
MSKQINFFGVSEYCPKSLSNIIQFYQTNDIEILINSLQKYNQSPLPRELKKNIFTLIPFLANSVFNIFYNIPVINNNGFFIADLSHQNVNQLEELMKEFINAFFIIKQYFSVLSIHNENRIMFHFFERFLLCNNLYLTTCFISLSYIFNPTCSFITTVNTFIKNDFYLPFNLEKLDSFELLLQTELQKNSIEYKIDYYQLIYQCQSIQLLADSRLLWWIKNNNKTITLWNDLFALNVASQMCLIPDELNLESYQFPFVIFNHLLEVPQTRNLFYLFKDRIIFIESFSEVVKMAISLLSQDKLQPQSDLLSSSEIIHEDRLINELSIEDKYFAKKIIKKITSQIEFSYVIPYITSTDLPEYAHRWIFSVIKDHSNFKGNTKQRNDLFYEYLKKVNSNSRDICKIYSLFAETIISTMSHVNEEHVQLVVDFFIANSLNYDFLSCIFQENILFRFYLKFIGSPIATKIFEKTLSCIRNTIEILKKSDERFPLLNVIDGDGPVVLGEVISNYTSFMKQLRNTDAFSGDDNINSLMINCILLCLRYGGSDVWSSVHEHYRNLKMISKELLSQLVTDSCKIIDYIAKECNADKINDSFYWNIESIKDKYRFSYGSPLLYSENRMSMQEKQIEIYDRYGIELFEESIGKNNALYYVRTALNFGDILCSFGDRMKKKDVKKIIEKRMEINVPYEYFRTFEINLVSNKRFSTVYIILVKEMFQNIYNKLSNNEFVSNMELYKISVLLNKIYLYNEESHFLISSIPKEHVTIYIKEIFKRYYQEIIQLPNFNSQLFRFTTTNTIDKRYRVLAIFDYILYLLAEPTTILNDFCSIVLLPSLKSQEFEKEMSIGLLWFIDNNDFITFKKSLKMETYIDNMVNYYITLLQHYSKEHDELTFIPLKLFYDFLITRVLHEKSFFGDSFKLYRKLFDILASPLNFILPVNCYSSWINLALLIILKSPFPNKFQERPEPFVQFTVRVQKNYFYYIKQQIESFSYETILSNIMLSSAYTDILFYLDEINTLQDKILSTNHITDGILTVIKKLCNNKSEDYSKLFELICLIKKEFNQHQQGEREIFANILHIWKSNDIIFGDQKSRIIELVEYGIEHLEYQNKNSYYLMNIMLRLIKILQEPTEWKFDVMDFIQSIESNIGQDPLLLIRIFHNESYDKTPVISHKSESSIPIISMVTVKRIIERIEDIDQTIQKCQFQMEKYIEIMNIRAAYFDIVYFTVVFILNQIKENEIYELIKRVMKIRLSPYIVITSIVKETDQLLSSLNVINEMKDIKANLNEALIQSCKEQRIIKNIPIENVKEDFKVMVPFSMKSKTTKIEVIKTTQEYIQEQQSNLINDTIIKIIKHQQELSTESNDEKKVSEIDDFGLESLFDLTNEGYEQTASHENENEQLNHEESTGLLRQVNDIENHDRTDNSDDGHEQHEHLNGYESRENNDNLRQRISEAAQNIAQQIQRLEQHRGVDELLQNDNFMYLFDFGEEEHQNIPNNSQTSIHSRITNQQQPNQMEVNQNEQPAQENQVPQSQEQTNQNEVPQQPNQEDFIMPGTNLFSSNESQEIQEQNEQIQQNEQTQEQVQNEEIQQNEQEQNERLFNGRPLPPDIDANTFFSLPINLQEEIIEEYNQQHPEPQNQNNTTNPQTQQNAQQQDNTIDFIYGLDPVLREDILRNADEAMLQLLPEDLRTEARELQREGARYGPFTDGGMASDDSGDSDLDGEDYNDHYNVLKVQNEDVEASYDVEAIVPLTKLFIANNYVLSNIALNKLICLMNYYNSQESIKYFEIVTLIYQHIILPGVEEEVDIISLEKALKLVLLTLYHRKKYSITSTDFFYLIQPIVAHIFEEKTELPIFIQHLIAATFSELLININTSTQLTNYIVFKKLAFERFVNALNKQYGIFSESAIRQTVLLLFTSPGMIDTIKSTITDQYNFLLKGIFTHEDLDVILSFCLCINATIDQNIKSGLPLISSFTELFTEQSLKTLDDLIKKYKNMRKILLEIAYCYLNFCIAAKPDLLKTFKSIDMFLDKYKEMVEKIIRIEPQLLKTSFNLLSRYPKYLTFEAKAQIFRKQIKKEQKRHSRRGFYISVHRNNIFQESYSQLMFATNDDLKGRLKVKFVGEQGIDMGGLRKEWLRVIATSMFNADYLLFMPTDDGHFQPNPMSAVFGDIELYKFIGRVVAKTVYDGEFLDVNFTKSMYKALLQQEVTLSDMESVDQQFYKNLKWLLENNVEGLDMKFCYEREEFGKTIIDDLIPNGRNIDVTDKNKQVYVKLLVDYKLNKSVKKQIDLFKEGFYSIIPFEMINCFYDTELELLISGMPDIDTEDFMANTEYRGYTLQSPVIQWFWEIFNEMEQRQKVLLLQFVTGSSKVPLGGFKNLMGNGGKMPFTIQRISCSEKLPVAHTCFNTIDIPEYQTLDVLKDKLLMAISECNQGFGMA